MSKLYQKTITKLTEEQKQDLRIYYTSGDVSNITNGLEELVQNATPEEYEAITGKKIKLVN